MHLRDTYREVTLMHVNLPVQQQVELAMDLDHEVNRALTASIARISDRIDHRLKERQTVPTCVRGP